MSRKRRRNTVMNVARLSWLRGLLAALALVVVPLAARAQRAQVMAVVGNPEVVFSGDAATVTAYCTELKQRTPRGKDGLNSYHGDVAVLVQVGGEWVRYGRQGTLEEAINDRILAVRGIDQIHPRTGRNVGRFDSLQIVRGVNWDGRTYKVKFNSGALFGADARDVEAGAGNLKAFGMLHAYYVKNRYDTRLAQRLWWELEQAGQGTETGVSGLLASNPDQDTLTRLTVRLMLARLDRERRAGEGP
jgi:hypothetical protein